MKQEYKEKFIQAQKLIEQYDDNLSEEENEINFWKGHALMEELVATKNTEVLCLLMNLFNKTNENGVCETLQNDIEANFTADQIIEAVSTKFDYLIENDLNRFANFSQNFFRYDHSEIFIKFREMFNKAKPRFAENYVDAIEEWVGKYFPNEIAILREDMKKW